MWIFVRIGVEEEIWAAHADAMSPSRNTSPTVAEGRNVCGPVIRKLRLKTIRSDGKKLTLMDLAARMEFDVGPAGIQISVGQLGKIERGEKSLTDRQMIAAARALGVSLDDLVPEELR